MTVHACIVLATTQTCKEEINGKIQRKRCLCVIRLCSLGQIKFGSFRHQMYWTSCILKSFFCAFIPERAVLYTTQCGQCFVEPPFPNKGLFLFTSLNRSVSLMEKCEPLKVYISSDNKMKGASDPMGEMKNRFSWTCLRLLQVERTRRWFIIWLDIP